MSNNHKFIFGGGHGMPPMMLPFMGEQNSSASKDAFVPPRIDKAMEFLELMALKQRKVPLTNEMGNVTDTIDGHELKPEEESTETAALQCLMKYFDGDLENNQWEEIRYSTLKNEEIIDLAERAAERAAAKSMLPMPGGIGGSGIQKTMKCPSCKGQDEECPICEGSGAIYFESAAKISKSLAELFKMMGIDGPPSTQKNSSENDDEQE